MLQFGLADRELASPGTFAGTAAVGQAAWPAVTAGSEVRNGQSHPKRYEVRRLCACT
jgi:hypothetical protein